MLAWLKFKSSHDVVIKPFDRTTVRWPSQGGPYRGNVEEAVPGLLIRQTPLNHTKRLNAFVLLRSATITLNSIGSLFREMPSTRSFKGEKDGG